MIVLLLSKFGFQANEAVTNLKLLEKGFSREDLAITVLIDFPFSILFGYYAAKWSTGPHPLKPWMLAFMGRLLSAVLNMGVVAMFPKGGVGMTYFILVIIAHVGTSFMRYTPPFFSRQMLIQVPSCLSVPPRSTLKSPIQ
jgi:MFS transporter, PAT family, solute carrier family 33 (acetyl-CoA transportor), member 1